MITGKSASSNAGSIWSASSSGSGNAAGRWIAEVFIDIDDGGTLDSLGAALEAHGHATPID